MLKENPYYRGFLHTVIFFEKFKKRGLQLQKTVVYYSYRVTENSNTERKGNMTLEIRAYYTRGNVYCSKVDTELCVPERNISDEEAENIINLLEMMGLKRHENKSSTFYTQVEDCNHSREYIFREHTI